MHTTLLYTHKLFHVLREDTQATGNTSLTLWTHQKQRPQKEILESMPKIWTHYFGMMSDFANIPKSFFLETLYVLSLYKPLEDETTREKIL